jgi:hypothetical protein
MSLLLVGLPLDPRPSPTINDLDRVARSLRSDPRHLFNAVRAIASDPVRCAEVAAGSYWHPNGFAKIKIFQYHDFSLRLHIWPPGENRCGDMNPHGHRWAFASWLLLGQGVVEKRYVESTDPDAVEYHRFRYRDGLGEDGLQAIGSARLRVHDVSELKSGGIYKCPTDAIHTVHPIGTRRMVTVVVQGPVELATASVYVHRGRLDDQKRVPLSVDDLRTLLRTRG